MQNLISVYEAAELLGVSRWTLERWKSLKRIPFVRLGRRTLFCIDDLLDFVEANKVPARE
jgi:excisionase family DNA binding protein